ncbi:hypothetical protein Tco_1369912 [Tanacetum coccineum]
MYSKDELVIVGLRYVDLSGYVDLVYMNTPNPTASSSPFGSSLDKSILELSESLVSSSFASSVSEHEESYVASLFIDEMNFELMSPLSIRVFNILFNLSLNYQLSHNIPLLKSLFFDIDRFSKFNCYIYCGTRLSANVIDLCFLGTSFLLKALRTFTS